MMVKANGFFVSMLTSGDCISFGITVEDDCTFVLTTQASTKGIVTFDSTIHFYNLNRALEQPLMLIVPDVQDVCSPLQIDFIVQLSEARAGQCFPFAKHVSSPPQCAGGDKSNPCNQVSSSAVVVNVVFVTIDSIVWCNSITETWVQVETKAILIATRYIVKSLQFFSDFRDFVVLIIIINNLLDKVQILLVLIRDHIESLNFFGVSYFSTFLLSQCLFRTRMMNAESFLVVCKDL
ncbi:uncharacterized protein LOC110923113 isoform X2 [Helianthus annuus]|nr:uncharacterized protein LOC110923113 isoform X2 [Helianthus annuus]